MLFSLQFLVMCVIYVLCQLYYLVCSQTLLRGDARFLRTCFHFCNFFNVSKRYRFLWDSYKPIINKKKVHIVFLFWEKKIKYAYQLWGKNLPHRFCSPLPMSFPQTTYPNIKSDRNKREKNKLLVKSGFCKIL